MTERDDGNGRVTLAILGTKIDYLTKQIEEMTCGVQENAKRINDLEDVAQVVKWVGATLTAISVALIIAVLIRWFGL